MAPLRQRDASDCIQTVLKRTIHCWHLSVFWSLSYLFQDETSLTYFSSSHQYLTFQKVMLDWFPSFLPSFQAVIAFLFISKQLSLMKRSSCELFLSQRFNLTKKQKISVNKKLERDEEKSVHSSSKSSVCLPPLPPLPPLRSDDLSTCSVLLHTLWSTESWHRRL